MHLAGKISVRVETILRYVQVLKKSLKHPDRCPCSCISIGVHWTVHAQLSMCCRKKNLTCTILKGCLLALNVWMLLLGLKQFCFYVVYITYIFLYIHFWLNIFGFLLISVMLTFVPLTSTNLSLHLIFYSPFTFLFFSVYLTDSDSGCFRFSLHQPWLSSLFSVFFYQYICEYISIWFIFNTCIPPSSWN